MSLELSNSYPDKLSVKTHAVHLPVTGRGDDRKQIVLLGDYEIPMEDFCELALYVLTNTDLDPNDPRLQLVNRVKSLRVIDGFNKEIGNDSNSIRLSVV